jgi:tetratricopeptide (TPR) repeat protein
MEQDLAQDAISAALAGDWETALRVNKQILQEAPDDVDALNRMARAYAELGNLQNARTTVSSVLKIDPFNTIAQKALERWKGLKNGGTSPSGPTSSQAFLEEPGKTKIVSLMHLGSDSALAELDAGDEVKFNCHSHRVSVCAMNGKYAGRLPDDLSARIRKLVSYGYEYKAFVKSIDKTEVKVFVREVKRPAKLSDIPSFPAEKISYVSFTPPELVHGAGTRHESNDNSEEES